jgi:hypothetical protein
VCKLTCCTAMRPKLVTLIESLGIMDPLAAWLLPGAADWGLASAFTSFAFALYMHQRPHCTRYPLFEGSSRRFYMLTGMITVKT